MGEAMSGLQALIGDWDVTADFGPIDLPSDVSARTSFEWLLGRTFVLQRATVDIPEAPDAQMVITPDVDRPGAYLQHYFDSRGVVRVYRMTFDGRTWELTRDEPDFSPLEFSQRFTGELSEDGNTITGQWEASHADGVWQLDFRLTYRRR